MRKILVFAVAVAFLGILALGGPAVAKPTHPTFGSFLNAGRVPHGSVLVLNIVYKVTNDEDSGNVGY
jgi:hypothetical protein